MSDYKALIVFTRYPRSGKVKTRLIGKLGRAGAALVHEEMTRHVLCMAQGLSDLDEISVEVHFAGGNKTLMARMFGEDLVYVRQFGADLGRRMFNAFKKVFAGGSKLAVLIGSDCPGITQGLMLQAFAGLESHDCVFGPATDGGYFLVGMKQAHACLFDNVVWGDSSTLKTTLEIARKHNLSYALTKELHDVDLPEDVRVWEDVKEKMSLPKISVVIPVLNEAAHINQTIEKVLCADNVEVIVVDGGSSDNTAESASRSGAKVFYGKNGRASQMNLGVQHATGDILLFVHGDTYVPDGYDRDIRDALKKDNIIAGAFSLSFADASLPVRIIEAGANIRSRYLGLPYGDQGLFLRKDIFSRTGGFPDVPILEDVMLVHRLGRMGKIVVLDSKAITSARRYKTLGVRRTWIINQIVMAGYFLGVPPENISSYYRLEHRGVCELIRVVLLELKKKRPSFL
jgi:rSAM/selenodomain-associated transferase 2/rSAM/selenodomain-associated transferase 1